MADQNNIGDTSNPKLNPPTKSSWNIGNAASRLWGKTQSFFGYDIWKEIEGHEWNRDGSNGFKKAREWLKNYVRDSSVHVKRKMLTQGKLYIFDYDKPKWEDKLPWFDTEPLVLSLGTVNTGEGPRDIGINMHILPPKIRRVVLCQIFEMYKSKYKGQLYARDQHPVQVQYQKLVQPLRKYGIEFAMRMYIPKLRKNVIEIRYEDWKNAIFIQSKGLKKITLDALQDEWLAFIKKNGGKVAKLNESWIKN